MSLSKALSSLRRIRQGIWVWAGVMSLLGSQPLPLWSDDGTDLRKTVAGVVIRVRTRTPEQIAAFYEARGFSSAARQVLANHCFIGVSIQNRSGRVVWLEPGKWKIDAKASGNRLVSPLSEEYWRHQWDRVLLSPAQRATFKWTQLPRARDLQPQEPVGGNLTLQRISGKFSLEMTFDTGNNRKGEILRTQFTDLRCPGVNRQKNR